MLRATSGEKSSGVLLTPELLAEIKRLELKSRRSVSQELSGNYRSAFRGRGLVFSDLREYQPGDEVRHINWKVSARSDRVYVKSYEEDRSLSVCLLIDLSRSTALGSERTKHHKILQFAALVALLASRNRDATGLALFAGGINEFIQPASGRSQLHRILSTLLKTEATGERSDLAAAINELSHKLRRRSIVFILSDFYCADFQLQLRALSARHDVILTLVEDPLDTALPSAGLVRLRAAEGNAELVFDASNPQTRQALLQAQERRVATLAQIAATNGGDFMRFSHSPLKPLADLMRKRAKRYR